MNNTVKQLLDWIKTIALAVLLSLVVRTYVAEARWIPSESMLPTLKVGDRLIVDKAVYKLTGIQRGDIVIFSAPPSANTEDDFVKRVIGLPGETISIKKGIVYINGRQIEENYINERPLADFEETVIPEDSVFVLGDNRNRSFDSRYWGPLPVSNIIGKAEFCYYPLSEFGTLD